VEEGLPVEAGAVGALAVAGAGDDAPLSAGVSFLAGAVVSADSPVGGFILSE